MKSQEEVVSVCVILVFHLLGICQCFWETCYCTR